MTGSNDSKCFFKITLSDAMLEILWITAGSWFYIEMFGSQAGEKGWCRIRKGDSFLMYECDGWMEVLKKILCASAPVCLVSQDIMISSTQNTQAPAPAASLDYCPDTGHSRLKHEKIHD